MKIRPIFCLFILLLFIFFLQLIIRSWQSWKTRSELREILSSVQSSLEKALINDPPKGFPLIKGLGRLKVINGPLPSMEKLWLIVVFGEESCEGCPERELQDWIETLDSEILLREIVCLLVFPDKSEKINEIANKKKCRIFFVIDEDMKIKRKLNVIFTPRAYGFKEGKLVWLQKDPRSSIIEIIEEFVNTAKGQKFVKYLINAWSIELRRKAWKRKFEE